MATSRTLSLACAFWPALAAAQEQRPAPPAELEQFKPFVGVWRCESTTEPAAGMPARSARGTFTGRIELDGFWFVGSYQEEKSEDNRVPERAVEMWGYDPATKLFTSRFLGTMHVTASGQSRGWEGDHMTWNDESRAGDKTFQERTTFTRDKTGKTLTLKAESLRGSAWTPAFNATCKK